MEHAKSNNFVDKVGIFQIVTPYLISSLKVQQWRWNKKFLPEKHVTLKCTRWELFKVTEMDTSSVIVLEDNQWHSVKRVLSSVYLNWQQLEAHFILIYQL